MPVVVARPAFAQVRWDVGVMAGATQRFASGGVPGAHPWPGPSGQVLAHVAFLPMVRLGAYTAFDLSPAERGPTRSIYAAGVRAKITPPLLLAPWRTWIFAGAGVADADVAEAGGRNEVGMLEFPVGVGIGHKLRGPWELDAELGARIIALTALVHGAGDGGATQGIGDDLLAVSLSVGVSLAP